MDQELAGMYGTTGVATTEDQEKVAEAELFAKLAAKHEIDLTQYTDEQVLELYNGTMGKVAEETCPECKKADCTCPAADKEAAAAEAEKVAAAQAEFQAKQEWTEKVAECDKLGRVMAHAYVQELGLIEQAKTAGEMPPQFAKKDDDKGEDKGEDKKDEAKDEGKKDEEKEASAIDHLAAKHAVDLAKEAGLDTEVAAKRLDAVLTLGGPGASEKTASASTLEENVHIRALEYLEAAGYNVTWAE
jgi:hypothetical protein